MTRHVLHLPVVEHRLDNGLRVVVQPDALAPGVAVNLWYHVGSGDELPGRAGFAHLFEHLMFQGSTHVASGEHFALLESAGGIANATTSFDRTNYFATVPRGALELALWLEADRMAGLAVTQANLDAQREVVKEEKRQSYDNQPYGDLLELLLAQHYPTLSPYGHTTIGSMADLDAAALGDVRGFFSSWYQPGNAVLTLAGHVGAEEGVELAQRYFGDVGVGLAAGERPEVGSHHSPGRLRHTADVPHDLLYLTWAAPPATDPASEVLEVLLSVLTDGLSARLHRRLVKDADLVESVGSTQLGLVRAPSIAAITARVDEGQSLDAAEDAVLAQLAALESDPPTQAELDRTRAQIEREFLTAMGQVDTRADLLGGAATLIGDPTHALGFVDRLADITPDDLLDAARTWLRPDDRFVLTYEKA